ncbi:anti-sigma factor [Metapseudomonas otitidis]|uniref:anti-sigma factor n=1 Tax=Metapseudomonas otitidis TaxID=319939 RepID=UPI0013F638EA|nr:anti-sigma factor [Pseudomonas otitidis]
MLNCRTLVACSSDYLDGRLGLLARLDARRHLLFCADCRRFIRQLALTRDVVRHWPDASPGEIDTLAQRLADERRPRS